MPPTFFPALTRRVSKVHFSNITAGTSPSPCLMPLLAPVTLMTGCRKDSWVSLDTSNLENHHLALKPVLDFLGAEVALCFPGPRCTVNRGHRAEELKNQGGGYPLPATCRESGPCLRGDRHLLCRCLIKRLSKETWLFPKLQIHLSGNSF